MMRVFGGKEIDTLLKEFGREALIWRQLSHPNLLPFFGLYYVEKRLCLVSPWMENGDIVAFLKREACGTDQLFSFILDVALGIEHLHEKDIVHGDLKPLNILVTPSLRACITDFGLSTTVAAMSSFQFTNSSKRARGGTVRYQAPELLRGGHNHLGSDIYAFACVAYELTAGSAPFAELRLDSAVIFKVLAGIRPSRPASLSPTRTSQGLWDLIKCCWKEQAQIRPTASRIVQALTSLIIRATTTSSNVDWDETFTSKFRRSVQVLPPLPSVSEIECMIFREQQITAPTPTVAPGELKTKAFICPLFSCGRLFKRMEHLRRHLRTHTMKRPRPFAEGEEDELGNEDVDTSMYPDNTQMRMCEVEVPGNPRDVHGDEEGLMMRVGDDLTIPHFHSPSPFHFLNPSPYVPASTFALGPSPAFASRVQTAYAGAATA
ncbi:kinase-like domain-containing protein [Mycena crocata]|nr:kinase-like domain-containing protein [Mycena crocata]